LIGIHAAGEVDGRAFYPSFARFYSSRAELIIVPLLRDPTLRETVFPGDDHELSSVLIKLDQYARREALTIGGWMGYEDPYVLAFLGRNSGNP
jgi:hypothetical protein